MQKLEVKVNIIFSLSDHVTYTLAIVPMIESRTWFIYIYFDHNIQSHRNICLQVVCFITFKDL